MLFRVLVRGREMQLISVFVPLGDEKDEEMCVAY